MLISTKGRYASRMLVDIAMHQGEDGYIPMKDVAARQQISKKYMEAFTAPLTSAGILGIRRGKTGVSLIEGPLHAVACLERPVNECARCGFCITLPAWEGLEKVVHDYLESVSLQDLIDQAKPQPSNLEDYPCGV